MLIIAANVEIPYTLYFFICTVFDFFLFINHSFVILSIFSDMY